MKNLVLLLLATTLTFQLCACTSTTSPNRYSQAQLTAIESRVVDASLDETFNAASGALFDAGYTIAMSDRAGGILTGHKGKDNTAARIFVSSFIPDTRFVISIQIRPAGNTTDIRIKTSINGEPTVDKKAIDQIWTLMQRQVLMRTPPEVVSINPNQSPAQATKSPPQSVLSSNQHKTSSQSKSSWMLNRDN